MDENLIGYLLGALDEPTRRQVEIDLRQNRETQEQLRLLKRALAPLAADREAPAPPPRLAEQALAMIAEHLCDKRQAAKPSIDLPRAPALSPATLSGGRSWWRRADVLVAACLLFTVGGIGLTVLNHLRSGGSAATVVECKNNLRQFYVALQQYRDTHGHFPDITKESPHNVAGMVVPMLIDAGTLPPSASLRCPGNGSPQSCSLDLAALRSLDETEFSQRSPGLSVCYAYSLGYRDDDGVYHVPGSGPLAALSQLPIMADSPPGEALLGDRKNQSENHGGAGQNVLFGDGHVIFLRERTFGDDDDIFLNRDRKVAAGSGASDIVLGPSAARP